PNRTIIGQNQAGAVLVKLGPLTPTGAVQFWEQSRIFPGCREICEIGQTGSATESGDHFGFALTAGDFNGDGRSDLAIGVPNETVLVNRGGSTFEHVSNAGEVDVIYGSASSLSI